MLLEAIAVVSGMASRLNQLLAAQEKPGSSSLNRALVNMDNAITSVSGMASQLKKLATTGPNKV